MDERAIVTPIPGTTRDTLAEEVEWGGILVRLNDTAGIREASGLVENLGVDRSRRALQEADLVLLVLDRSAALSKEDREIWQLLHNKPYALVVNKIDLPNELSIPPEMRKEAAAIAEVSALTGENIDQIKQSLLKISGGNELEKEEGVLTSWRHYQCVRDTRRHLLRGIEGYESGLSEEFPLYDLRNALSTLGRLTGETSVEEILGQIFSRFCIGK